MSKHIIRLNPFDSESISSAISEIERIQKDFEKKCNEFMDRIANIGVAMAQSAFGSSVIVEAVPIKNGFRIVASGETIGFLEFGAGSATSPDIFEQEVSYEVAPGSYSKSADGSGEYAATGKWHFGGVEYQFVAPSHGMYQAYEEIIRCAEQEARSVFKA